MITEDEAITAARLDAEKQGWAWASPVRAILREGWLANWKKWEIYTHPHGMGAKARYVIDAESGEILERGYVPR